MQAATVTQVKRTLHREQLKRLRAWAKAEPAELRSSSQRLCDHLYDYIQSRRLTLSTPQLHSSTSALETAPWRPAQSSTPPATAKPPLFILAYLPLFYEVDLVPLMQQLWPTAAAQNIHVLTPVVLPSWTGSAAHAATGSAAAEDVGAAGPLSSAMVFVEVFDEADLNDAFAPQGDFNIREFHRDMLEPWLRGPACTTPAKEEGSDNGAHTRAEKRVGVATREDRVRHMVLCDSYAHIFPAAHAAGYRPSGLLEYTSACADTVQPPRSAAAPLADAPSSLDEVALLVLAPGVLFDVQTGHRLGKGRGYYDRFLDYHAQYHHQQTKGAKEDGPWEVVAVAFDSQVLHSAAAAAPTDAAAQGAQLPASIPVDERDQVMHAVVSPSGGVERVRNDVS